MSALEYTWHQGAGVDSLSVAFKACKREPRSWKDELYASARLIAERANKPLWILASGGIDSEVTCRAFYDQGIDFSVLTIEHVGGTNRHDITYAIDWCRKYNVKQKIVSIEMQTFLTDDVERYAREYVAIHPFRYFHIKMMELVEEMGGYAVLGCGDPLYYADTKLPILTYEDMYLVFGIGSIAPLEWQKKNAVAHEPYFLYSTPELCLSYLRLPLVSFALRNPETVFRHPANTYTLKRLVYFSIWTDMKVRYKSSGWDRIKPLVDASIERLHRKFGPQQLICHLPVGTLEKQLTAKLAS
jgi:hypothetical protein